MKGDKAEKKSARERKSPDGQDAWAQYKKDRNSKKVNAVVEAARTATTFRDTTSDHD